MTPHAHTPPHAVTPHAARQNAELMEAARRLPEMARTFVTDTLSLATARRCSRVAADVGAACTLIRHDPDILTGWASIAASH